jgi:hypothetical protein
LLLNTLNLYLGLFSSVNVRDQFSYICLISLWSGTEYRKILV